MSDTRTVSELLYIAAVVQLDGLDFARQFTRDEIAANYAIDKARFNLP